MRMLHNIWLTTYYDLKPLHTNQHQRFLTSRNTNYRNRTPRRKTTSTVRHFYTSHHRNMTVNRSFETVLSQNHQMNPGGERTGGIRIYECHPGLVSKDSTTSPLVEPGISALGGGGPGCVCWSRVKMCWIISWHFPDFLEQNTLKC